MKTVYVKNVFVKVSFYICLHFIDIQYTVHGTYARIKCLLKNLAIKETKKITKKKRKDYQLFA